MRLRRLFIIGFFGNIFEWYDFSIFAYLATILGQVFFDAHNPKISLLKIFSVFSVSYLARPLGSIFFGAIGDKTGRSNALKLSMILMAAPAFLIGLLPNFDTGGIAVVILLIVLRVIQGFAAGGEFPSTACYVYELSANINTRFFCSVVAASPMLGVLSGSLVATAMYVLFSKETLVAWAWRLPFLFSMAIIIFLFYIRKDMLGTHSSIKKNKTISLLKLLKYHNRSIIKLMMLHAFISISFYLLFVWMPSYLSVYLGYPHQSAFLLGTVGLAELVLFTILLGYFIRKTKEKMMAVFSILSIMLVTYPAFILLGYGSLILAYIIIFMFALFLGCIDSVIMSVMGDLFAKEIRCSGISISFTLPTAILGGLAPTICSYLIYKTNWALSPVLFLLLACIIALPAALTLNERTYIKN